MSTAPRQLLLRVVRVVAATGLVLSAAACGVEDQAVGRPIAPPAPAADVTAPLTVGARADLGLSDIWSTVEVRQLAGGRRQRIALLDSGLAAAYVEQCPDCRAATSSGERRDEQGHGTSMAAIIAGLPALGYSGVAPDADVTVMPLAPGRDDLVRNESLVAALDQAVTDGYDLISISLGSQTPDPALRASMSKAVARGIVVVASAGPDPSDIVLYPAALPGVLAAVADAGEPSADGHSHKRFTEASRFPTLTVPLSAMRLPRYEADRASFTLQRDNHSSEAAAVLTGLVAGYRSAAAECRNMPSRETYLSRVLDNGRNGRPLLADTLVECTAEEK